MGKHERHISDELEINLTAKINGQPFNSVLLNDDLIHSTANHILNHYQDIESAEWIGTTYVNNGDILFHRRSHDDQFIELKYVINGKGTAANMGQDSLTQYGIFDVTPWSLFRKERKQYERTIEIIGQSFKTKTAFYDYCRELRDKNTSQEKIKEIVAFANAEKIIYRNLLRDSGFSENELRIFIKNMLHQNHSRKTYVRNMIGFKRNCDILYVNKIDGSAEFESNPNDFVIVDDPAWQPFIEFPNDTAYLMIGMMNKELCERRRFYQIAFHWKNIFQGIKTPCLNIFDCRR